MLSPRLLARHTVSRRQGAGNKSKEKENGKWIRTKHKP